MLNKIQNNVHSMLSQAQKITKLAHHTHHRKHTAEINSYIDIIFAPRFLIASSKNLKPNKEHKKRSTTTTQNQKQIQRNYPQKRLKTEIVSKCAQYRLQPLPQQKDILPLQPDQTQLLSTKIFGLNKPKFLKKIKQTCLPKIRGAKNIKNLQPPLQQDINQSYFSKWHTTDMPSKISLISSLSPEQNMILIRQKKKRSLSRNSKKNEEYRSPIQSLKRHKNQLSQLQPWESDRAQSECFQR